MVILENNIFMQKIYFINLCIELFKWFEYSYEEYIILQHKNINNN